MVKLYEFRNAEIDTCVYGLAGVVENFLIWEAADKGSFPESATY